MTEHAQHHDEVLAALAAIGNPRRGEAIRLDRGSELQYLGIGFPALRARVKQGFSFSPANPTVQPGPSNAVSVTISAASNPPAGLYPVTVSPSAPGPCFTQDLGIQFGP